MPSILGSVFGTPAKAPDLTQTDYTAAANQGAAYNQSQIGNYESYAPGFTNFIKNLYGQTVNPQATAAQNTQYNLGNQLATQGYSNAQSNFLNYSRTLGLENAAATGAPVSGTFAQGLGTNIGMQQILQNQLQGQGILGNYAQNQQNLAQGFMAPSQSLFRPTYLVLKYSSKELPQIILSQIKMRISTMRIASSQVRLITWSVVHSETSFPLLSHRSRMPIISTQMPHRRP